ncbi:helix-turn-helix domain-containing protein [Phocicoccus pinnipedialis]|uniref:helix-turn-helix domain-containing protein n=1 Tax=Phocicoccus pinnipedialis TaxID=110845 RepID=UPI001ABB4FFD|nr:helix-turn-helix domain-containing protein [Jeotgalicoccus pinnipedialis]
MKRLKLGSLLRKRREQSGITLKEMSERSGLKRSIIQIIETGEFLKLPNPKHAKLLILEYTEVLNLNGHELIERYKEELPTKKEIIETRQLSQNDSFLYLKKSLITLGVIILSLFVIWFILLQIGADGNLFTKKPIYDAVSSEGAVVKEQKDEVQKDSKVEFVGLDGNTLVYNIETSEPIVFAFHSKNTLVNLTDNLNTGYVYDSISEGEYEINDDATELLFAVEDATSMNITINNIQLDPEDRSGKKTVFYQFNIERK